MRKATGEMVACLEVTFYFVGLCFSFVLKMLVDLSYNRPGHIIHKSIGSNDVGFAGIISRIG